MIPAKVPLLLLKVTILMQWYQRAQGSLNNVKAKPATVLLLKLCMKMSRNAILFQTRALSCQQRELQNTYMLESARKATSRRQTQQLLPLRHPQRRYRNLISLPRLGCHQQHQLPTKVRLICSQSPPLHKTNTTSHHHNCTVLHKPRTATSSNSFKPTPTPSYTTTVHHSHSASCK